MERPYLVLWFALAFFGILVLWGIYHRLTAPPPIERPPATQSLLEQIQQRRREIREAATTTTAPATQPAGPRP